MKKGYLGLLLLFTTMAVSCSNPKDVLPDVAIIQKEGQNITDISFNNIPEEGIKRGLWNSYNISMTVTYADNTNKEIPLPMKSIPREYRNYINTVGTHKITILFRGVPKSYTLKILESDVKFDVNYYTYNGDLIAHYSVEPGDSIPSVPAALDRREDDRFIYRFTNWEVDLNNLDINDNYDVYPVYVPSMKRNHFKATESNRTDSVHRVIYQHNGFDYSPTVPDTHTFFHLGRIQRAVLGETDVVYQHTQATSGEPHVINANFTFDQNKKIDCVKSVINSAFDYAEDASTYEEHLYGEGKNYLKTPNYNYMLDQSLIHQLGEYTVTKFADEAANSQIYTGEISALFGSLPASQNVTANVPMNSLSGYYRIVYEADIDVFASALTYSGNGAVYMMAYNIYLTYNPATAGFVVDYSATNNFESSGRHLLTYNQICQEIYHIHY